MRVVLHRIIWESTISRKPSFVWSSNLAIVFPFSKIWSIEYMEGRENQVLGNIVPFSNPLGAFFASVPVWRVMWRGRQRKARTHTHVPPRNRATPRAQPTTPHTQTRTLHTALARSTLQRCSAGTPKREARNAGARPLDPPQV